MTWLNLSLVPALSLMLTDFKSPSITAAAVRA
jgi:hypothetical protein